MQHWETLVGELDLGNRGRQGGVQQDHAGLQSASPEWGEGYVLSHSIQDVEMGKLGGGKAQTDELRETCMHCDTNRVFVTSTLPL